MAHYTADAIALIRADERKKLRGLITVMEFPLVARADHAADMTIGWNEAKDRIIALLSEGTP